MLRFAFCLSWQAAADKPGYWYNTSSGSLELNEAQLPVGFFHYPIQGMLDGYPLVIDPQVSRARLVACLNHVTL